MDDIERCKIEFKAAFDQYQRSLSDEDYENCMTKKRILMKCQQMAINLQNKRLEEIKKNIQDEALLNELFPAPIVEEH